MLDELCRHLILDFLWEVSHGIHGHLNVGIVSPCILQFLFEFGRFSFRNLCKLLSDYRLTTVNMDGIHSITVELLAAFSIDHRLSLNY